MKTTHIRKLCKLFNKRPHYFIFDNLEQYENENDVIYEKIEIMFDASTAETFKKSLQLNAAGRERLKEYINELCQIQKYRKP